MTISGFEPGKPSKHNLRLRVCETGVLMDVNDAARLVRESGTGEALNSAVESIFGESEADVRYRYDVLTERDQARFHAETLYAALKAAGHDWPALPWTVRQESE